MDIIDGTFRYRLVVITETPNKAINLPRASQRFNSRPLKRHPIVNIFTIRRGQIRLFPAVKEHHLDAPIRLTSHAVDGIFSRRMLLAESYRLLVAVDPGESLT